MLKHEGRKEGRKRGREGCGVSIEFVFFRKNSGSPVLFRLPLYTTPRYRSTEVATNVKSLPFRDDTTAVACVNCIVRRSRFILPVERDGGT